MHSNMGANPRPAPMFAQAHNEYKEMKAAQPPPKAPSRPVLAKQLFPSSSPNPVRDGNIESLIKKPDRSTSSFRSVSSAAQPLKPRPENLLQRVPSPGTSMPPHSSAGSKSLASLYNEKEAFRDVPVIDFVGGSSSKSPSGHLPGGILIEDGDIEDYDDLNLDYEEPQALPPLPPPATPSIPTGQGQSPPAQVSSTQLSWSQSSPSHRLNPQQRAGAQARPAKRESLGDDASSPPPAAKKRAIPKAWRKQDSYSLDPEATPPSRRLPWNDTESAVKAQRKQLKTLQKKSSAGPEFRDHPITGEAKEAVKSHTASAAVFTLSNEQQHVKSLVVDKNQSVFFTGPAGTGKSVLMRSIIHDLKKKHARDQERVAVTASTGLAACNIGGMTLHSFAGIGLGKEDAPTLVKKIRRNAKAKNRWLRTKTLVIDEISMVDGELFDKLSQIGRTIRNNGRPWGGIQLVITGDFFQLPPVPDYNKQRDGGKFAFEAATWTTAIDHTIGLTEVFRQRDPDFARMLNEMRLGQISNETIQAFQKLARPLRFDDGLQATELFPTRQEVENSNERRLRDLPGKAFHFESSDSGDPNIRDRLLQNMMAPKSIVLKKGAQVMLIKNMDETLVNGSLGTVTGFMTESTFELTGGIEDAGSDGEGDPKVMKRIKAFSSHLDGGSSGDDKTKYPLVKFHSVDGTERTLLCVPEDWKVELPTGEVQASRKQLPLILAWALSIHKAQGQTLERVKVDLGNVFEKGQAYVALSRATSQQGLQVLRFQKAKVMAHPRVIGFYTKLYSAETAVKKKPPAQSSISSFAFKKTSGLGAGGSWSIDSEEKDEMLRQHAEI